MGTAFGMRVTGLQQGRGEERALGHTLATRCETVAGAEQLVAALQQAAHPLGHIVLLVVGSGAPMRTPSSDGSPTTTLLSRSRRRVATASMCLAGTMARRMAVHFCPALVVISRTTSLMYRSNSSLSGVTSGPRMAQFSESASAVNGTELRTSSV